MRTPIIYLVGSVSFVVLLCELGFVDGDLGGSRISAVPDVLVGIHLGFIRLGLRLNESHVGVIGSVRLVNLLLGLLLISLEALVVDLVGKMFISGYIQRMISFPTWSFSMVSLM